MFSSFFEQLARDGQPDMDRLARMFDVAITKKLAVIELPPAFWMNDPKINPRADHLLWAALLLGDRERTALAVSVLAVEVEAGRWPGHDGVQAVIDYCLRGLASVGGGDPQHLVRQYQDLVSQVSP